MTTLPQTAPLRLPRPPATTALSIPGVMPQGGMISYAQAATTQQMTGADVVRVLRSNLLLIVLMLVVSGVAGYALNYWLRLYHPSYTAVGTIQTLMPRADDGTVRAVDNLTLLTEMHTHADLLKQQSLLTRVLQDPDNEIRNTAWFRSFANKLSDAKDDLEDNLEVAIVPESNLMHVSMKYSDPRSCQVIVTSIVNEYIKEQQNFNRDKEYNRNQELIDRRNTEDAHLREVNASIADLEAELNSAGDTGTMNRISTRDLELTQLLEERTKADGDLAAAKDDYAALVSQINTDQDPPQVASLIYADPQVSQLRSTDNELDMKIQTTTLSTDSDNPVVKQLTAQKAYMDRRLASAITDARVRYRTAVTEEAKQKLSEAQRAVEVMNKRIENDEADMAHLTDVQTTLIQNEAKKADYEAKIKVIDDQLDQLAAIALKQDFSGVDWANNGGGKPELPDVPTFPKLAATMSVSMLFGLVVALGIAFARELMDTSIRSPRDISRVGNMNLLGMVPHENDDPQSAGARLPLVIFEAPHSMMAEQLRQVRTRLQHSSSLDTTRSILITSPTPGDGKSTVACNLASGLALNGRRILLVDANFRRPELHRIFNVANEQGFSDVLNSLDTFEQLVQETQVPNLYILTTGVKPANATELLESQLLMDFIERALEEFDHVIFDSGPMLLVSETVALAPRVDGVVTVVRARQNSRGVLTRLRDSLRQVKAEHLGVVLNAVRAQGGGYYGRNIRTYYEYQSGAGSAA